MKWRKIILIPFLLFLCFLVSSFLYLRNPKQKIIQEDEGIHYLELYNEILSTKRFDLLLEEVIRSNNDIHSLNMIANFALRKSKCHVLPLLQTRCEILSEFPTDSIWTVKITNTYSRKSSREMLELSNSFCKTITRIENKCHPAVRHKEK